MSQPTSGIKPDKKSLATEDFINHTEVLKCVEQLNTAFPTESNPLIVSDVLDSNENQYVNLVQKGGGVLGIALVGYTYILEKMGIRFLRLAGTSAGAINTALMTVTGKKEDPKSVSILKAICDLNFFNLVDGHPAARWIIKKFITHQDFTVKVKKWLTWIVMIAFLLIGGDFIFLGLEHKIHFITVFTKLFFILTGFYFLLIGLVIFYCSGLFRRLKNSGYGINPGDFFYDWIKQQLVTNGVKTVDDLNKKASEPIPDLYLRVPNPDGINGLNGDVTFITPTFFPHTKIKFPATSCSFM